MVMGDPALLYPLFEVKTTEWANQNVGWKKVLSSNRQRVAIMWGNAWTVNVSIYPAETTTALAGFTVPPTVAPIIMLFSQVGALVQGDWSAFFNSSSDILYVTEVLYRPIEG